MHRSDQVIHIHPLAPPKPLEGDRCNGCGVCCLSAPCPLGMALSGRRTGACKALRWNDAAALYRCGALTDPDAVSRAALPKGLHLFAPALAWLLGHLAQRWIAAGVGCDSSLQASPGLDDNAKHDR